MRPLRLGAFGVTLALLTTTGLVSAADLTVGALGPDLKVRQADKPTTTPTIALEAAKNEFESFQIVVTAGAASVTGITAKVSKPFIGPGGATIPAANVVLYAEAYYDVKVASNDEGGAGKWPDPLIPDVDTYFGEKRNAFPMTVAAGQSGAIWIDLLVPQAQAAGDYSGEIEVDVGGAKQGAIAVTLHVGSFALPSTSSLASAFGMGWDAAPAAHCVGTTFPYCGDGTGDKANAIRALYLRAALEHRFTVSDTDFQPPFGGDQALYEKHVMPLIDGSSAARLPGAKLTAIRLDGGDADVGKWITYAKSKGFFDRLIFYPTDEPGSDTKTWSDYVTHAGALHKADPAASIIITSTITDALKFSADGVTDVFVPVIDELEGRPGSTFAGDQRSKYDAWQTAKASRRVWGYQSCDEHGCGSCHTPSPGVDYTGWPNRVIDSSAVQDRAFPWHAFRLRLSGELYFETTYQLKTAWDADGQCAFSGSGDGTVFYPGTPAKIGGTKDIPIESIRMKMIREGMEDYEYLALVAKKDPAKAKAIADGLFPHTYDSAKPPKALEDARHQLFVLLDSPTTPGDAGPTDGGPGTDGGATDSGLTPDGGPSIDGGPGTDGGIVDDSGSGGGSPTDSSGCGCALPGGVSPSGFGVFALVGLALSLVRRRRLG